MFVPLLSIFLNTDFIGFITTEEMITVLKVITIVSVVAYLYTIHAKPGLRAVVNTVSVARGGSRTSYDGHFRQSASLCNSEQLFTCSHECLCIY